MSYAPFSGETVVKVMVNSGIYEWERTRGDHAILRWEPPAHHDAEPRTVPVPLHDELSEGTLQSIADQAGAKDYQEFKAWIDRNRLEDQGEEGRGGERGAARGGARGSRGRGGRSR